MFTLVILAPLQTNVPAAVRQVYSTVPADLTKNCLGLVLMPTNRNGDWQPWELICDATPRYKRRRTKKDGNCLFEALAAAVGMPGKTPHREMRKLLVECMRLSCNTLDDAGAAAMNSNIAALFSPVLTDDGAARTRWRVYDHAELGLLRTSLKSPEPYNIQRDHDIYMQHGAFVHNVVTYLQYLSCSGRTTDSVRVVSFQYRGTNINHIGEDVQATFGGDLVLTFVARALQRSLWIYVDRPEANASVIGYLAVGPFPANKPLYLHLEAEHYEPMSVVEVKPSPCNAGVCNRFRSDIDVVLIS